MPGGRGPGVGSVAGEGAHLLSLFRSLGQKLPRTTSLTGFCELSLKNWEVAAVPLLAPSRTMLKVKGSRHFCHPDVPLTERNVPGK